ncbi:MAG: hypothetical protein ACREBU_09635 [Nitrososphaera sp.]
MLIDFTIPELDALTKDMPKEKKLELIKEIFRFSLQDKDIVTKGFSMWDNIDRSNLKQLQEASAVIPESLDSTLITMKLLVDGHTKLYREIVQLRGIIEAILLNDIDFRVSMKEFIESQTGSQKERDEKLAKLMTKMEEHDTKVAEIAEQFGNVTEKLTKSERLADWLRRYSNDIESNKI